MNLIDVLDSRGAVLRVMIIGFFAQRVETMVILGDIVQKRSFIFKEETSANVHFLFFSQA